MRKVRDFDAELKALNDKARSLKAKRVEQLGQLVAATGADALDVETLAGVLLDAVASKDASAKETWRAAGTAFFRRRGRGAGKVDLGNTGAGESQPSGETAHGSDPAANR